MFRNNILRKYCHYAFSQCCVIKPCSGFQVQNFSKHQHWTFRISNHIYQTRTFHKSFRAEASAEDKKLVLRDSFETAKDKSKNTYLDMIRIFNSRDIRKSGHVEFIYAAMKHMEEFGVHKDLEVYKSLLDIFPKGKFIPQNMFQVEFQHYPKHQQCAIDVLEKMEDNGIIPDQDVESILLNVFGKKGHPVRKMRRMLYWMPKFKNLSPWPLPNPVPNDALELAKLALQRIGSVDLQMKIDTFNAEDIEDSIDKTWIVSAQSPSQQELLAEHPSDEAIFVEGAFKVWLRGAAVNYFILRAEPRPETVTESLDTDDVSNLPTPFDDERNLKQKTEKTVHEQVEGTILALAATGTSSRDSLLSWIRCLQHTNPALGTVPVLFSFTSPFGQVVPVVSDSEQTQLHPSHK